MYTLTSALIEVENNPGSTEGKKKLDSEYFLKILSVWFSVRSDVLGENKE